MNRLAIAAISLTLLATCAPDSGQPADSLAAIEGVVVDAVTGAPIAGASVHALGPDGRPESSGTTDAHGRFALHGLAPGRRLIAASKAGYVRAGRAGGAGVPFSVAAGEGVGNARLRLTKAGVITGRVLGLERRPIGGARLELYRQAVPLGRPQLMIVATGSAPRPLETRDDGVFRIEGVAPGRYYMRIIPSNSFVTELASHKRALASVFYPGVNDFSKAVAVDVRPGQETLLPDIVLKQARAGRIRVRLVNATGERADFPLVTLKPAGWVGPEFSLYQTRMINDVYEFQPDFRGTYEVSASWMGVSGRRFGFATVRFDGVDAGVTVRVAAPKHQLQGRGLMESGNGAFEPLANLEVAFGPNPTLTAVTNRDGEFLVEEAYAGRYQFGYVRQIPDGAYVAAVRQGGQDVLTGGLVVPGPGVEVVVSRSGGVIEGRVIDGAGAAVHDALVALVPEKPLRDRTDYYGTFQSVSSDQNGAFEFRGIHPGEYRLYAWSEGEEGMYRNADLMKPFEPFGRAVRIEKGGRATVELKALDK